MAKPILEELKKRVRTVIDENRMSGETVKVKLGTLTVKQAIGDPNRKDFPLLEGREVMIEAELHGSFGQAFTDSPHEFTGTLDDVLEMELDSNQSRAVFIASLNAVMSSLGKASCTRHCHDEEPEECAEEMARFIKDTYKPARIGMIGLQPAILDHMVRVFGEGSVVCTDLAVKNIGTRKYGAEIWDGKTKTEELIRWADLVLATSSTIVNRTYDHIAEECLANSKRLILFGVTGAGTAALCGLECLCFQGH